MSRAFIAGMNVGFEIAGIPSRRVPVALISSISIVRLVKFVFGNSTRQYGKPSFAFVDNGSKTGTNAMVSNIKLIIAYGQEKRGFLAFFI